MFETDPAYAASLNHVVRFASEQFDVFISYSSADTAVAMTLSQLLNDNGIRHWYAPEYLKAKGGRYYMEEIVEGIHNCSVVLLIYSAAAERSSWVKEEISLGLDKRKIIITLRIDDTPLRGVYEFLGARQLFTLSFEHPAPQIRSVLESIQATLCMESGVILPSQEQLCGMLGRMIEPVRSYSGWKERWHYDIGLRRRVKRWAWKCAILAVVIPLAVSFGYRMFTTYPAGTKYTREGRYTGEMNLLGWRQGYGVECVGKMIYSGGWLFDCRHGEGMFEKVRDTDTVVVYKGGFFMNALYGQGKLSAPLFVYEGRFFWNKYDGYGELKQFTDSTRRTCYYQYAGSWKSGLKHGRGRDNRPGNRRSYDGEWHLDRKEGFGVQTDSAALNVYIYQDSGYHRNYQEIGIGGYRYEGQWKNDEPFGKGSLSVFFNPDCADSLKDRLQWNTVRRMKGKWGLEGAFSGKIAYSNQYDFQGEAVCFTQKYRMVPWRGVLRDTSGTRWEGTWREIASWKYGFFQGTVRYADGSRYEGCLRNGKPDSVGTMYYADGGVFTGVWDYGEFENGKLQCPDGTQCTLKREWCQWRSYYSGHTWSGSVIYPAGDRYDGFFVLENDRPVRVGTYERYAYFHPQKADTAYAYRRVPATMHYANGDCVEAIWEQDTVYSYARIEKADGVVFCKICKRTTSYRDGSKKTGIGAEIAYPDGRGYSGYITSDWELEEGRMHYSDGSCYDGMWKDGKPSGKGTFQRNTVRYEGEWDGESGTGTIVYPNGERYQGAWFAFRREGYGVLFRFGKLVHQGFWRDDKFLSDETGK